MRTRTLLLLAVSCGLAILLAGGIQLWRLANQEPPTPSLEVGGTGMAGDAIVTVTKATDAGDAFVVTVTLAGVDDHRMAEALDHRQPLGHLAQLVGHPVHRLIGVPGVDDA